MSNKSNGVLLVCREAHQSYRNQLLHCLPLVAVRELNDDDVVDGVGGDGGRRSDSFSMSVLSQTRSEWVSW